MIRALILVLAFATPAAAFELESESGKIVLDDRPESVAVLSRGLAGIALDLGLPVTGVADASSYRTWAGAPPLPQAVRDMGLRIDPNLEVLSDLAPDLIPGSDQQIAMTARLSAIAPTAINAQFSAGHDNSEMAHRTYRRLAAWGGEVPPVLSVRPLTPTTVRIHGTNSIVTAVRGMSLTPAAAGPATECGGTLAAVEALADYPDAASVHFDPFAEQDVLFVTPLWQATPALGAGRFAVAEPAWTFGGAVSLEILAERLAAALVTMGQGA